jgi:hypothetical protein
VFLRLDRAILGNWLLPLISPVQVTRNHSRHSSVKVKNLLGSSGAWFELAHMWFGRRRCYAPAYIFLPQLGIAGVCQRSLWTSVPRCGVVVQMAGPSMMTLRTLQNGLSKQKSPQRRSRLLKSYESLKPLSRAHVELALHSMLDLANRANTQMASPSTTTL